MPKKRPGQTTRKGSRSSGKSGKGGKAPDSAGKADTPPRIIGGRFRAKRLVYSGDPRTRPMKERVREATFNLVGPVPKNMLAIDLFAGTGALGLEAMSRGASDAILIERHFPTTKLIRQNCENLGVQDHCTIIASDAFYWVNYQLDMAPTDQPWLVFISPPYAFYEDRLDDMTSVIERFQQHCPPTSIVVAEFDDRFSAEQLPQPDSWNTRLYAPAFVAIWRKESSVDKSD